MHLKKYSKILATIALLLILAMVLGSVAGSFLAY